MRVHVFAEGVANSAQARAYAEYRLFVALARHGALVQGAQIELRCEGDDGPSAFRCRMTVSLEPTGRARTCVYASHAYAAIDQAADRIGHLIHRRAARPVSS
jgi:ribosome-associated translation inhibitor RaiA